MNYSLTGNPATIFFLGLLLSITACSSQDSIDRHALVHRHIPTLNAPDSLSPFTVGNGTFAYTVGITGLQTFADYYEQGIPLGTQSHWGWHSVENAEEYKLEDTFRRYNTYGRQVTYAAKQHSDAGQWLRANPHRLHLGKIGFNIRQDDGSKITLSDISNVDQSADIWEGIIRSNFTVLGDSVEVQTAVHPERDQIAASISSDLLKSGRMGIGFEFPYGSLSWGKKTADWKSPGKHQTNIIAQNQQSVTLQRTLDTTRYYVKITWNGDAHIRKHGSHSYELVIDDGSNFGFTTSFSDDKPIGNNLSAHQTFAKSRNHWNEFWQTGGAIDLSESTDPRAHELERRIVLSRYLTAIQTTGTLPPAETGLTYNSWYGKFHLEMHWWHGVHYVLWDNPELFERSLPWYTDILPMAQAKAERQGYEGARWPKMVSFEGRESPSTIGVFLTWQQPHPIYYAELLYNYYGEDRQMLDRYKEIVFETADFMASYAHFDSTQQRYVLGPPLIPGQEIYAPDSTFNPTFELSYWQYGLQTAQQWRERLGMERNEKWDHVLNHLSELPQNNGYYQNAGNAMNTFRDAKHRNDHPSILGAYGMLPNDSVDVEVMQRTLIKIMESWNWNHTWGWDYPMTAMNAARVGKPEIAINALLMDVQKNTYLNNGHNYQDENLTLYLPGNGGLLTAVAMMAAGWEGAPDRHAPGFPDNGEWVVKYENLLPLP